MLIPDYVGVENAGVGREGVHCGVQPLLSDGALQGYDGVKVAECGHNPGVSIVVGGDVDCLEGRDGAGLGRSDTLLKLTHFRG